jgi:hypothetical protein
MLKTQPDSLARIPEQEARHKWFGLDFNFCMLKKFCATRKLNSVSTYRAYHHRSPKSRFFPLHWHCLQHPVVNVENPVVTRAGRKVRPRKRLDL